MLHAEFVERKCVTNVQPPHARAAWGRFGDGVATKCLGVPIGGAAVRAEAFHALAERVEADVQLIGDDGAAGFALLRFCAGAPRVVHALRALEAGEVGGGCGRVDAAVGAALGRLAGVSPVPAFAALPLRMGGCGTTSTLSLAPAARLAGRLAVAQGDDPWPLVLRDASEGAWCACGAVRVERGCSRCALCCAGERGAGVCGVCRDAILTAARSLPDARWGWVDGAAAAWRATTALPPDLVRGFVAIAGARKQSQRALHFASLQPLRARLLAAASPFVARRLESNAAVSARALYTFDGLASCPLSRAAFAYALRLRLTFPGATSIAPVACSCPSAGAGRRDDRRRRFAAAPGLLGARANDWHARACKVGPLARGAHQAVAASLSLFFARRGIVSRWEAGGVIPAHGGRRCDLLALMPDGPVAIDVARCDVEVGERTGRSGIRLLARREEAKIRSYAGLLPGVRFAPLVVDEVGRLGPASALAVERMAAEIDGLVDAEPGTSRAGLFACIAAAVADGQHGQLVSRGGTLSAAPARGGPPDELRGEAPLEPSGPGSLGEDSDDASSGTSVFDVQEALRGVATLAAQGPPRGRATARRDAFRSAGRRAGPQPDLRPERAPLLVPPAAGSAPRRVAPRAQRGSGGAPPPAPRPRPQRADPYVSSVISQR